MQIISFVLVTLAGLAAAAPNAAPVSRADDAPSAFEQKVRGTVNAVSFYGKRRREFFFKTFR